MAKEDKALLIALGKPSKKSEDDEDTSGSDKETVVQEIIDAVGSKDAAALVEALDAYWDLKQSAE